MSTHLLRPLRLAQRLKAATASCIPSTNTTQPKHPISTNTSFTRAAAAAAKPSLRQWYQSLWRPRDATATLPPYDHVTQIGDPLLRRAADPVPVDACGSAEVRFLVDRLVHVMRAYKCVGLAAPQIGIALRVMVMEFNAAHMDSFAPDVQRAKRMALLPLTVREREEQRFPLATFEMWQSFCVATSIFKRSKNDVEYCSPAVGFAYSSFQFNSIQFRSPHRTRCSSIRRCTWTTTSAPH